jgi:bifunctional non-homologous end joining protein LigD
LQVLEAMMLCAVVAARIRPTFAVVAAVIPKDADRAVLKLGDRQVTVTNLRKPFWPGITKGDLLQYYFDVAPLLLPHIRRRPMVMKRYPHGAEGEFFFMKRAPSPRPAFIDLCHIEHSKDVIDFPLIDDVPSLMWVVNLGCIDLNPWYARCDDWERPDFMHFDLDPGDQVGFAQVKEAALLVREQLSSLGLESWVKTTGSRGLHVYVPIVLGPTSHQVWSMTKVLAEDLARRHPKLLTVVYRLADRPQNRVHVDFNQNSLGRTLASIYSVRPRPRAPVSTPIKWSELPRVEIDDFRLDNVRRRLARVGDLWAPLLERRFDLRRLGQRRRSRSRA